MRVHTLSLSLTHTHTHTHTLYKCHYLNFCENWYARLDGKENTPHPSCYKGVWLVRSPQRGPTGGGGQTDLSRMSRLRLTVTRSHAIIRTGSTMFLGSGDFSSLLCATTPPPPAAPFAGTPWLSAAFWPWSPPSPERPERKYILEK